MHGLGLTSCVLSFSAIINGFVVFSFPCVVSKWRTQEDNISLKVFRG